MKIILSFFLVLTLLTGCESSSGKRNKVNNIEKEQSEIISNNAVVQFVAPQIGKPVVNVYVENSGSMDGYVNGVTEFEQSVYNYLSDIKISRIADSLNLFYINSRIIKYGSDIEDFILRLEPSSFKAKGGDLGTSDISNVIKSVLQETNNNVISMLVTDGIFSPGKGKDANQYLVNQQIGIKGNVAEYINNNPNASIIIYQLSSQFNGRYYNYIDSPIQINTQRPFYIWVIGDTEQLSILRSKVPESKFQGSGVQNMFSITTGNKSIDYAVKLGSGNFSLDKQNPKTAITDWKRDSKGLSANIAKFSVNADLSGFLLDDSYLMNEENYELSDKDFSLSISKAAGNQFGYTHTLNLSSEMVKKGIFSIKLKSKVPQWIYDVNDDEGTTAVLGKTYGIKYQIQGVYDAFTFDNDCFTEIKVFIK